jgi:carbon monoxide dehydrogenase subunit G
MKIEGTHELRAGRDRVYQSLIDPEVLKRCIPGCESLEKTVENAYALTLRAGVGAIKGLFTGSVKLEEMQPPSHYRIVVEARGQPGFVKGSGDLDLEEREGGTLVKYSGEVQIGGTIAAVGQRMIQGAAKMMAGQFFTAIEAEAAKQTDEPPPKHGFFRTALRWFSGWLRKRRRKKARE